MCGSCRCHILFHVSILVVVCMMGDRYHWCIRVENMFIYVAYYTPDPRYCDDMISSHRRDKPMTRQQSPCWFTGTRLKKHFICWSWHFPTTTEPPDDSTVTRSHSTRVHHGQQPILVKSFSRLSGDSAAT